MILEVKDAIYSRLSALNVPIVERTDTLDDAGAPVDIVAPFLIVDIQSPTRTSGRADNKQVRRDIVFQVTSVHSHVDAVLDLDERAGDLLADWRPTSQGLHFGVVAMYAQASFPRLDATLPGRQLYICHSVWNTTVEPA